MPDTLSVIVNGATVKVPRGVTAAAAMLIAGQPTRISVSGQPRVALCGMGVCFECRALVNGTPHRRTCQVLCEDGMTLETNP